MILLILSLTYTYYNPAPAAKPPVVEKKAPIVEKKAAPASPFANIFGASKPAAKTAPVAKKGKKIYIQFLVSFLCILFTNVI